MHYGSLQRWWKFNTCSIDGNAYLFYVSFAGLAWYWSWSCYSWSWLHHWTWSFEACSQRIMTLDYCALYKYSYLLAWTELSPSSGIGPIITCIPLGVFILRQSANWTEQVDPVTRRVHWSRASASRLYFVLIGCYETRTASARSVLDTLCSTVTVRAGVQFLSVQFTSYTRRSQL